VWKDGPYKDLPIYGGGRRHSFADNECGDMTPRTANGQSTPANIYGETEVLTFKVRPPASESYDRAPTAMSVAGLTVAMMDGSIRTVSPSVAVPTFWALVTPAGGEVVSDW